MTRAPFHAVAEWRGAKSLGVLFVSGRMEDMDCRLSLKKSRRLVFVRGSLETGSPVNMRKSGRVKQDAPDFMRIWCV